MAHPDTNSEMLDYYAHWWENPRDPRHVIFSRFNDLVRARVPRAGEGQSALDLGSGHGTIVEILIHKGYRTTAIELDPRMADALRARFPQCNVITGDVAEVLPEEPFDVVTAIHLLQNLNAEQSTLLLRRLRPITKEKLLLNISSSSSIHGIWLRLRGFRKPFVYHVRPSELERLVEKGGFEISFTSGVGFLTPLTLRRDFRWPLIPRFAARRTSFLDTWFPRACQLFYVEAS